jgi:hypothetical protein
MAPRPQAAKNLLMPPDIAISLRNNYLGTHRLRENNKRGTKDITFQHKVSMKFQVAHVVQIHPPIVQPRIDLFYLSVFDMVCVEELHQGGEGGSTPQPLIMGWRATSELTTGARCRCHGSKQGAITQVKKPSSSLAKYTKSQTHFASDTSSSSSKVPIALFWTSMYLYKVVEMHTYSLDWK